MALEVRLGGTGASTAEGARYRLGLSGLDLIVALVGPGFIVKLTDGTYAIREIEAGNDAVTVTNGDGQSGNPTINVVYG